MVKAHVDYLVFHIFRNQIENHPWKDVRIKPLLNEVARVGALKSLIDNVGPVFDAGYFSPSASKFMSEALDEVIRKLRPQLIPLVEAKQFPEFIVPTNIGNFYGDIYE